MSKTKNVRLFVESPLAAGITVTLDRGQAHYLATVMRVAAGDRVLLFNGIDGEWLARVATADKKSAELQPEQQTRPQAAEPDVWLAFAPLKKDRTDFAAEKATELGCSRILPVMTSFTNAQRINVERLRATAREAAEQCGRLSVPDIVEPAAFSAFVDAWPIDRRLIYLDETGSGEPLVPVFADRDTPLGLLIGPEGGFAAQELDALGKLPLSVAGDLGPRILRAETAVAAALAIRQAVEDASGRRLKTPQSA